MPRKLSFDRILFLTILVLCVMGLVMVYSASAVIAAEQYGSPYHFLMRQALALVVGLAAMGVMMKANYRAFGRSTVVYAAFGITALLLVGALLSPSVNGTHRWMKLGPLSLQPSEFAKLVLILFLSWRLQRDRDPQGGSADINNLQKTLVPCLVLSGFMIFLVVLQPDLGTAVSLCIYSAVMLVTAGLKLRYLGYMAAAAALMLLIVVPMKGYQMRRVTAFMNPEEDPLGAGYQVRQSTIAVGAGGVSGAGLSQGQQKLFFLPYPYTDFVYSVIGEELGLAGAGAVVLAFLVLLWRGLRVASRAPDLFGSYLAAGITMFLVIQAMINMGVALGMLPAKGLPLPFISYGGSSLVAGLAASGVLLNISQYSN
ncbi:MAG TPA: putative lipid II flippase FtsW [Patescibacteria group bacterium]|jgi:cell division protein FtsW|nr:putative lipid II flippase FtsW [Patescibacteria group bacterium]